MSGLIGVYGGSFNPPHKGHIEAARAASEILGLSKVIFVPANIPPHKALESGAPDGVERAKLLEKSLNNEGWAEISAIELERGGVSYTYDTLSQLKEQYGDGLCLLVGTDMFTTLDKWYKAEEILKTVDIAVFSRYGDDKEKISKCAADYRLRYDSKISIISNVAIEISSTELREMLVERKGREYLAQDEYAYIISKGMYGAKPDYEWLREQAYSMLKPKRIPHVKGTEKTAVELAELYGENIDDARTAAILHDITKKLDLSEQLILCKKYGIILDDLEMTSEKLLHSKTGAGLSKDLFGISDRVYEAIRWHTTGKADMTLLEKIIYMADYIEPTRDFEGVAELRALAYKDLDDAMLKGLKMSETELMERRVPIHPKTKEALDYFKQLVGSKHDSEDSNKQ